MSVIEHSPPRPWVHRRESIGASSIARTALLMAALIALLGIGGWLFGGDRGLSLMIAVGLATNVGSYWFSDRIALRAHRAWPVTAAEAPRLATAHLFIINPLRPAEAGMFALLSTHPPVQQRTERLRAMRATSTRRSA